PSRGPRRRPLGQGRRSPARAAAPASHAERRGDRHRPRRRGDGRQRGADSIARGQWVRARDRPGRRRRQRRDVQHQRRPGGGGSRRCARRREAHPPDRRARHPRRRAATGEHARSQGRRAPRAGRRDRRRHAAQGGVIAAGARGRYRQGAHHRRACPPRHSPGAVHPRRHRHRDRAVREPTMDGKQLIEWSTTHVTANVARAPIVLVRGDGMRVWDTDGREYLDFGAGLAVTALGHSHPRVTGAIREAAATLLHVSNLYYNAPAIHLAKLLCEHSFADQVYFGNSGAEANEAAIKMARKYAKERFATDRYEIIATHNSFHGRTMATVTATGQPKYHHGFEPLVPGFKHVPYNDPRAMERAFDDRTAAILVEPMQGEGGVHIPGDDYLPGLRKLCDESGALLILDEIQTGVGRTGRLWAYEHSGIEPDIMTVAKALANGLPI